MKERNCSVEILRIASSFLIVWYHVNAFGYLFAYSGIVCFIEISTFFIYYNSPYAITTYIKNRFFRLVIPWFSWSILYGLLNIIKRNPFLGQGEKWFNILFTGTYIHLWYLPFIFIVSLVLLLFVDKMQHLSKSIYFLLLLIALSGLCFVVCMLVRIRGYVEEPFAEWLHALPATFIGLSISAIYKSNFVVFKKNLLYLLLLFTILFLSLLSVKIGQQGLGIPYLFGTFFTLACFKFEIKCVSIVYAFANLTMGIYLIHPLIISIIHKFLYFITSTELIAIIGFVFSMIVVFSFARIGKAQINRYLGIGNFRTEKKYL